MRLSKGLYNHIPKLGNMPEDPEREKEKLKQSLGFTEDEIEIFLRACREANKKMIGRNNFIFSQ